MANYNKQFNFRNGVQVDNDNLVVSPTGLVGIGTTIPTEALDVRGGNAKVSGFATATSLYSRFLEVDGTAGVTTITFTDAIGAGVSISGGIITATGPITGIVTYYGDARYLQGMPTSQWVDIDAGLGYTSIYAQGNVGVGTTDPRFTFQVGGNTVKTVAGFGTDSNGGVGICSSGNVLITGITTANKFVGIGSDLTLLDADNISSGTLTNDRIPVLESSKIPNEFSVTGVITASRFDGNLNGTEIQAGLITATSGFTGDITGNVTGIASTALSLSGTPDITVGVLTATDVSSSTFTVGVLTATAISASSFIGGITGDVTGNVTGTATTATSLTSDAVVNIDQIKVGLATVDASIGIGTDFYTGFIEIGGTNTGTADLFINRTVGVTTTDQIPATIKLLSDRGRSAITIGTSESDFGYNGQIRYANRNVAFDYSTSESFDFINYGNGNINSYLQAGTVGVDTGSFYWHDKNEVIMSLTYEGKLGIGVTNPTDRLHVNGTSRFTGDVVFDGDATYAGNLNVSSIVSELTGNVSGNVTGNVDGSAGISTFNNLSVTQVTKTGQIGVSTDVTGLNRRLAVNSGNTSFIVDTSGRVGVRTDSMLVSGLNAPQADIVCGTIGVSTDRVNVTNACAVDFGQVGSGYTSLTDITNREFMRVPRVTAAQITAFTGLIGGEIVYDIDNNVHKGYNGTTWNNLY